MTVNKHIGACTHTYTHARTHTHTHTHKHTHTNIHTQTHTHKHTNTQTHKHTNTHSLSLGCDVLLGWQGDILQNKSKLHLDIFDECLALGFMGWLKSNVEELNHLTQSHSSESM